MIKHFWAAVLIVLVLWVIALHQSGLFDAIGSTTSNGGAIYRIYLTSEISSPQKYNRIIDLLDRADPSYDIRIYLIGPGGRGDAMFMIGDAIAQTRAKVTGIVIGDVYSAHAYLALVMPKLIIRDKDALMLFHYSSFYNSYDKVCSFLKGNKDRGQDAYKKCIYFVSKIVKVGTEKSNRIYKKYLTNKELQRMKKGFDVIINAKIIADRKEQVDN